MTTKSPIVVGVAGGSGSGKTTVVQALVEGAAPESVSLIHHDAYYRNFSGLPMEDREKINFDHPDSLETPLLVEHLTALRQGRAVEVPTYDFATHTRRSMTEVALASGFSSCSYFSKCYTERYGGSPSEERAERGAISAESTLAPIT